MSAPRRAKQLDQEIATALAKPRSHARRARLGQADRDARGAAISTYVELPRAGRVALTTARETADANEHARAIESLAAVLPTTLWIGHDRGHWFVQSAEPVWNTADPEGEDPAAWSQLPRTEIVRILVEEA